MLPDLEKDTSQLEIPMIDFIYQLHFLKKILRKASKQARNFKIFFELFHTMSEDRQDPHATVYVKAPNC